MIIRPCEEKDLKVIASIEHATFPIAPWSLENFVAEFKDNDYAYIFVAEINGNVVGYIDFWILFEQGTISKIAVLEPLRKYGIGDVLLKDALKRMTDDGVTSVTLEVRVSNIAAIRLYEKNGFEKILIKKSYYSDGEDAHFMMLGKE